MSFLRSSRLRAVALPVLVTSAFLTASIGANAVPITAGTYQLFDHGDGALGTNYGLRVDDIDPPNGQGPTFSMSTGAADVQLTWDGGATALIEGILYRNDTAELYEVSYTITGVSAAFDGFVATGGTGTLTNLDDGGEPVHILTGEQNGAGYAFEFLPDGHRLAGDNTTPVGRGWLLPPGSTDDFLFRAAPVPEPSAALLYASGLAAVGANSRRARKAASR